MASRQVLALCGDTYTNRLWCEFREVAAAAVTIPDRSAPPTFQGVWELYTLFAFAGQSAVDRIHVIDVSEKRDARGFADSLQVFDYRAAHCYDPNEEAKIRAVIRGGGAAAFNKCIWQLGAAVAEAFKEGGGFEAPTLDRLGSKNLMSSQNMKSFRMTIALDDRPSLV